MRPEPLLTLLESVNNQTLYPNEILIVDGSLNNATKTMLDANKFANLQYFLMTDEERGLTKQRNFGILRSATDIEIICFLDDDTIVEISYFEELLKTYQIHPEALGACGYITNEASWEKAAPDYHPKNDEFFYDGWKRKDSSRFLLRKKLKLDSALPPGFPPDFAHGRSVNFLPPSGKLYEVQQLMGGVSSFRKRIFETFSFSHYFEGYGLYEDADFTLRVSKIGKLYVNTNARVGHYHNKSGRPNKFNYGKMVVRNGWYVWRVKDPNPSFTARMKWHVITILLMAIRFSNIFTTSKRMEALTEALGRKVGWLSLLFNKPTIK